MSFSASTCITDVGTASLGPTLIAYSNPISPSNPGTYIADIPTVDILSNCPYTFLVPNGTTSIRLYDPVGGCYADFIISDNNMCTTCSLDFNYYLQENIGTIVAGDITGSCDSSITDYLIYWYEESDPNTVKFTSGKGNEFTPYLYPHPLTGTSAVLATSGVYSAVLQKINLNGTVFSISGGTGTVIGELNCLPAISNGNPIIIDALTCTNGNSNLPQYDHYFNYQATTAGVPPQALKTNFRLNSGQNFFVWQFRGFNVPDKVRMTLSGSAYSEPIILEYWEIGDGVGNDYSPSAFPNSGNTNQFFGKATCLTGLTINSGDEILIEVIPSTANTQTSWTFYCGCLDTFDCNICSPNFTAPTSASTTSYQYPIKQSTIELVSGTCESYLDFKLSADCNYNQIINSDYFKYAGETSEYGLSEDLNNLVTPPSWQRAALYNNRFICQLQGTQNPNYNQGVNSPAGCYALGPGNTVKYEKSPGLFKVTSDKQSTIGNYFYLPYLGVATLISPFSGDNSNFGYYRYFTLDYPAATGGQGCGDGLEYKQLYIAQQTVVTTGQTGSDYWIQFTMPTQTLGMTFNSCDAGCGSNMIFDVNSASTGVTRNYTGTSTNGVVYRSPISNMYYYTGITQSVVSGTYSGVKQIYYYQNETYPFSGSPGSYTRIPELSGETCSDMSRWAPNGTGNFSSTHYYYTYELANPALNRTDFRIYSCEIKSTGVVNCLIKTLVYEKINGVVTVANSNYLV